MNEISQILEPKEKIVYEGKPRYAPYITSAIFGTLIFTCFIGIFIAAFSRSTLITFMGGIVLFIGGIIISHMTYVRTHYAITNKRVIIQTGVIGRDFKSVDYDRIQNVSVDVGLLGVIFKVGSIKIFTGEIQTVGSEHPQIQSRYDRLNYISLPYETLKKLQVYLSARKEKLA